MLMRRSICFNIISKIKEFTDQLPEDSKKKIDLLVSKLLKMNEFQARYLELVTKNQVMKNKNLDPLKLSFKIGRAHV